jgi:hypothetical protein
MSVYKKGLLDWCSSVEETFSPREDVPHGEEPKQIPEQFLAAAIRYLRAVCAELPDISEEEWEEEFLSIVND